MSININSEYIYSLKYSDNVRDVSFEKFMQGLDDVYGEKVRKVAIETIFNAKDTCYQKGLEEFKNRFMGYFIKGSKISGPDQKYLAKYVQRVAFHQQIFVHNIKK